MSEPLKRHQILLFDGDWERLKQIYTVKTVTSVVRELVRAHCDRVEAEIVRAEQMAKSA
jgi:hypothetical protein